MKKKGKYITREDAIARLLGGMEEHLREPYAEYIRMLIYTVPDAVQELHWIPCKEKLPEKEEKSYLVYLDSGNVCECRWWCLDPVFLNPTDHWRWHFMDRPQFTKVLAWMPLPEPYKGERKTDE